MRPLPPLRSTATLLLPLTLWACTAGEQSQQSRAGAEICPADMPPAELQHLIGSMHEHSGYSDGEIGTTPADFFAAGAALGMDFMLSSDHSDNLRLPLTASGDCLSEQLPDCLQLLPDDTTPLLGLTKWEMTADLAAAASTEDFTALRGFEWTSDRFGHINVFLSQNEINAKTTDGYALSMEGFWLWFGLDPALAGGGDGLAVFNHPGREDAIHAFIPDPAYAFNDFALNEATAERVVGVEVFGKGGDAYDTDNGAPAGGWYAHALDQGWRLGPVGAEDEHGTSWATPERAKTVLLASDRSPEALREALLARRFYALAQHHNDLRLSFTADGLPMGSRIHGTGPILLQGAVTAGELPGGFLEIVGSGGDTLATAALPQVQLELLPEADPSWYFLRLSNADNQPVAYSAPIWVSAEAGACGEAAN